MLFYQSLFISPFDIRWGGFSKGVMPPEQIVSDRAPGSSKRASTKREVPLICIAA
jgi:hypothetical protein